ncbi:heme-dependent oxidative N-demethylase family protein [Aestuariivirga sp.]|uniref:heme-dependent oxidative N-demethylase family protein n=1 Tax=Aestuariivirga sp. TaxID=2650926 RepID=UPI003BA9D3F1
MNVPAKPEHRPYLFSGAVFEIGLRPMDMAQWLDTGSDHADFMAAKRARLNGRPPLYYQSLERSRPAQSELLRVVAENLLANHGTVYSGDGPLVRDHLDGTRHNLADETQEPLEILGNLVEEDFVLFAAEEGGDIVTAASNAYTSSGRIVSCVGRNMRFAHDPVPGLNEQLGARIDRVIGNVQPGKPVVRFNWFVTPIASRLFPERSHAANIEAAEQVAQALVQDFRKAGELLWLRVERQTFVRLPETGALAFGIHTYSHPLSTVADDVEGLAAMDRLLAAYSEDRLRYGGMLATRDPIRRWIAEAS